MNPAGPAEQQIPPALERSKLKWFHYAIAALASYLTPWLAMLLGSGCQGFDFTSRSLWLGMLVPGGITFLLLLPFLRFPILRRIALVCFCLGWMLLFSMSLVLARMR